MNFNILLREDKPSLMKESKTVCLDFYKKIPLSVYQSIRFINAIVQKNTNKLKLNKKYRKTRFPLKIKLGFYY